jgi:hypothetical protein
VFKQDHSWLLKNRLVAFCLCILFSFGFVKLSINLFNPAFGWDSLNYHFTFAVEWLKSGSLNTPIIASDDPSPSYYPINASLFYLWLMLPLKSVFLADLGQFPFFILAALSLFGICRKFGLDKEYSFYATALFLLIPNFFKQLQIAYVDIMVAGVFLACLNYLLLLQEAFSWQNVFIYSISIGLFLGLKTTALPYSGLLIIPFIYLCFKNQRKVYLALFSLLGLIILGGFSYIRNIFDTGNPFYPLDFVVMGKKVFGGVIDMYSYRNRFIPWDYSLRKFLLHEGLGLQSLIFILPAVLLSLPALIIKRYKGLNFRSVYFTLLPFFMYLIFRFVIPLANVRYIYALLGVGIFLFLYLADIVNIPKAPIKVLIALSALSCVFELAKRWELVVSVILTAFIFFLVLFFGAKLRLPQHFKKLSVLAFLALVFLFGLIAADSWYGRNEFGRYFKMLKYSGFSADNALAWDWLNRNTQGENIAYVGKPLPFSLYGNNFKNNVSYVSVNKTDPAKLHFFKDSNYAWGPDNGNMHKVFDQANNYRGHADYNVWLGNLYRRKIRIIFIYSLQHVRSLEFPIEDKWAREYPNIFKEIFSNQTVHIYRIIE